MPVTLDVWVDYTSALCYLELPELRRVQSELGVGVTFHAFELHPEPVPVPEPGGDAARRAWARSVQPMMVSRRHPLRPPGVAPRSRLAAEAVEFARDAGRLEAMQEGVFAAHLRHGRDTGLVPVLADVGVAAGLSGQGLRLALDGGRYTARVLHAGRRAVAMGVTDVPAMVVSGPGGVQLVAGAQPFGALREVVEVVQRGRATGG